MGLFEFFFEPEVPMPGHASAALIDEGVAEVCKVIEEERRQREAERERFARLENSSVRYKTVMPPDPESSYFYVPERRCPPKLKAAHLSFAAQLLTLVKTKYDGCAAMVYKRAGIRRQIYSRIVSNDGSCVGKRTALQFCIGLQLSRAEADDLLGRAGYALSRTIPSDCAFAYCIEHRIWNLEDVNAILAKCGQKLIEVEK